MDYSGLLHDAKGQHCWALSEGQRTESSIKELKQGGPIIP